MIRIKTAMNFTKDEQAKLAEVVDLANKVLASPVFRAGVEVVDRFTNTLDNGYAVYDRIMGCDQTLTVGLYTPPWYKRWSSAIARENPDGSIEFRRSYFTSATNAELAGTVIHELCHKAGYIHSFWNTPDRPMSVPYYVGDLAEEIALRLHVTEAPEVVT